MSTFEAALADAVDLLRALPRDRARREEARSAFATFAREHEDASPKLLVDARPGFPALDFDVLLRHPGRGTVGVTFRDDDGTPWSVAYADHWASNFVVTVDDADVTIQEALVSLKLAGEKAPDLMERIVADRILATAIAAEPAPVDDAEVQTAADAFRASHALFTADSFHRRLAEWGVSLERFRLMLVDAIRRRKLRERIAGAGAEARFDADRDAWAPMRIVLARTASAEVAARIAREERGVAHAVAALAHENVDVALEVRAAFAHELPPAIAGSKAGARVGPIAEGGAHLVADVIARDAPALDARTRDAIGHVLFREWLDARRAAAKVKWHWL